MVDDLELLHRQVYETYPDGTAMSVNFRPTKKDEGLLSTRQNSMVGAQQAHEEHLGNGWQSVGTWSFMAGATELDVIDDSADADTPTGHASVDFTMLTRGERERAGKRIKAVAVKSHPSD
jgi:hypothetical protein